MFTSRHFRFILALGTGVLAGATAFALNLPPKTMILITANLCFANYLMLELRLVRGLTPDKLRARAAQTDEGVPLIFLLAFATIAISVTAIFLVINRPDGNLTQSALALASIPLGWAVTHTMAAFHYAYLYYAAQTAPDTGDTGGISFPDTPEPGVIDFLYFAFTIGMTAQVSDTVVTRSAMRKTVLIHGILSFFFNTSILALAVSAALTLGR